jgi:hypothetical protein
MKLPKKAGIAVLLLLISIMIHLYSSSSTRIESGYSIHFYIRISHILRTVFGWIPFSFGDIFYGLLVIWVIWRISRFLRHAFQNKQGIAKTAFFKDALLDLFIFCSCMYIIFNIFWGMNYNRKGIAWQLKLNMEKYEPKDLEKINEKLVEKINASKKKLTEDHTVYPASKELFSMVSEVYKNVADQYPFLSYQHPSIKSSMWGWLGNYTGFTGYYNPFTAEAQLNTTVPKFLQPFIACHEVAHQLGYAKENEANFVGYLAAANSDNSLFQYSVYLELFIYANRNLYILDSVASKIYMKQLHVDVVKDLAAWRAFNRRHRSFAEPIVSWVYDKYLQGNQQPNGVLSYDEVTAFMIAYYKKFGKI